MVEVLYHLSALIFKTFYVRHSLPKFFKHVPARRQCYLEPSAGAIMLSPLPRKRSENDKDPVSPLFQAKTAERSSSSLANGYE